MHIIYMEPLHGGWMNISILCDSRLMLMTPIKYMQVHETVFLLDCMFEFER